MIYMVEMAFRHPEYEAEWNAWYLAHIGVLLTVPGFRASQRFRAIVDNPSPYLALHEVASAALFDSSAYRSRGGPSSVGHWRELQSNWHRNLLEGLEATPEVPQDKVLVMLRDADAEVPLPGGAAIDLADRHRARPHGRALRPRDHRRPGAARGACPARRPRPPLSPDQRKDLRRVKFVLAVAAAVTLWLNAGARAETPAPSPVAVVVSGRLLVGTQIGTGTLPVFVSRDWSHQLATIHRVIVIVHGYRRNAADYAQIMLGLKPPPETMVVAPQFLAVDDIEPRNVPDHILRWKRDTWASGMPADDPVPQSSFDAIDAVLAALGNRTMLPNLTNVVLAGFSAGGQLVQRYAVVGKGDDAIGEAGVKLRYVVGSPSSFVYFGGERPQGGRIATFPDAPNCPQYGNWRYGFAGELPPYVAAAVGPGVPDLEHRYAARDVVYLVGGADTNPHHRFLDTSCAGEAQGPDRLARTRSFFEDMRQRDADILRHSLHVVDGAAHEAAKVLGSPCGRAALFDEKDCPGG